MNQVMLNEIGQRQQDKEEYIQEYSKKVNILRPIHWVFEQRKNGQDWKAGYDAYQQMYYESVVNPAAKEFDSLFPDQGSIQLDFEVF